MWADECKLLHVWMWVWQYVLLAVAPVYVAGVVLGCLGVGVSLRLWREGKRGLPVHQPSQSRSQVPEPGRCHGVLSHITGPAWVWPASATAVSHSLSLAVRLCLGVSGCSQGLPSCSASQFLPQSLTRPVLFRGQIFSSTHFSESNNLLNTSAGLHCGAPNGM